MWSGPIIFIRLRASFAGHGSCPTFAGRDPLGEAVPLRQGAGPGAGTGDALVDEGRKTGKKWKAIQDAGMVFPGWPCGWAYLLAVRNMAATRNRTITQARRPSAPAGGTASDRPRCPAPWSSHSVVSGRTTVTSLLESGWTVNPPPNVAALLQPPGLAHRSSGNREGVVPQGLVAQDEILVEAQLEGGRTLPVMGRRRVLQGSGRWDRHRTVGHASH